jgi:N-glycosylase/DNA lyase
MNAEIFLETPKDFSFRHTVYSHGWSELLPFELDDAAWKLRYVFLNGKRKPFEATISEAGKRKLRIEYAAPVDEGKLKADIRHILRLDEDLLEFYTMTDAEPRLRWVAGSNAGRLVRSPTVFEDLVKSLCTTNCSWALTKNMVRNLVELLGDKAAGGKRAFPTPKALAGVDEEFFRKEIRAGYRSSYFAELAAKVASGELDPEAWLHSELPTAELKKQIKSIKGIGDYAAENLLKLIGRYDGLALDSWLRAEFYKKHNKDKACGDAKIEKFYKKFGDWKGLAIWCDMTERWFDERLTSGAR